MHIQRRHLHLPFADHHRQIQALREMKSVVASSHPPPTHLFIRQRDEEEEEEEYPRAQHFPFATLVNFYKEISTFFCSTHPISQSLSCTTIHSTTDIHTRSSSLPQAEFYKGRNTVLRFSLLYIEFRIQVHRNGKVYWRWPLFYSCNHHHLPLLFLHPHPP